MPFDQFYFDDNFGRYSLWVRPFMHRPVPQTLPILPMRTVHGLFSFPLFAKCIGALDGGPPCRLSILRNGNVPCGYFRNVPVDFKIV